MKSRKKKKIVGTTLLSSKKTRSRKINRLQGKIDQKWPPTVEEKLDDLFLFETKRKVHKDRTVSLGGQVDEVDAALVDETVTLRYDPAEPGEPVQVCHNGRFVHTAKLLDAYANCFVKRNRPTLALEVATKPQHQQRTRARTETRRHLYRILP